MFLEEHIKIALREKIRVCHEDMAFLPTCFHDITWEGAELAMLIYLSNPQLRRSWSEPLWECCLIKLCELLNDDARRARFWIDRLLETKKDVLDFLRGKFIGAWIDSPIEDVYHILFDQLLETRPELAFELNKDEQLFYISKRLLKITLSLERKEPKSYDVWDDDHTTALLDKTFGIARTRAIQKIRERCSMYKEELMMAAWHPDRIERLIEQHGLDVIDMM